jgi:serine/threonine-protein kinase RsbW
MTGVCGRTAGGRLATRARNVEVDLVDGEISRRPITIGGLAALRSAVSRAARTAGVGAERAERFAVAVNEAATNTIVHAGGTGEVTVGVDGRGGLYARVVDRGPGLPSEPVLDPPEPERIGGRGVWLIRQLVDAVRIEDGPAGTVVYMGMTIAASAKVGPDEGAGTI